MAKSNFPRQHRLIPTGRVVDLADAKFVTPVYPVPPSTPSLSKRLVLVEQAVVCNNEKLAALTRAIERLERLATAPSQPSSEGWSDYYGKLSEHEKRLLDIDPTGSN